jgi:acyl-coenzyme A synthetase/AMP-(fatty) acid ligase|tara:strand:- start:1627 stop:3129 length:1503 start_codon:yes stop_codon:yes gene_type:complete
MLSNQLINFIKSKKNKFILGDYKKEYTSNDVIKIINKFVYKLRILLNSKKQHGIGIYLSRDSYYFIAIFSIWLSGNYFIPLNQLWPKAHLRKILKSSNPKLIISNKSIVKSKRYKILYLKDILNVKTKKLKLTNTKKTNTNEKGIAYIIYTSGSTGDQKGVIITRENFYSYLTWVKKFLLPQTKESKSLLVTGEMTFDIVMADLANALSFNSTIYLTPETNNLIKAFKMLHEKKIETLYGVPSTLSNILLFSKLRKKKELKHIKNIFCGGDIFTPKLLNLIKNESTKSKIFNMYGPTELTMNVLCQNLSKFNKKKLPKQIPNGRGFKHLKYKFYDISSRLFNDKKGELLVSGKQCMRGYLNDPKNTSAAFIYHNNKKYYRTGDLFMKKGGVFFYIGRTDRLIKIKGYRVNLNSIDEFFNSQSLVKEAKSLLIENQNEDKKIITFLVLKNNDNNYLKRLEKKTKNFFPTYMCPNKILILKKAYYNESGKLDEKYLKKVIKS